MKDLTSRIRSISNDLLSDDEFNGMKGKPVPAEIGFAFGDSLDDAQHNLERQGTEVLCQKKLQSLARLDDESLKSDLTQTLVAVQTMTRNLEKDRAGNALPGSAGQPTR
jgi:hypothetical protein